MARKKKGKSAIVMRKRERGKKKWGVLCRNMTDFLNAITLCFFGFKFFFVCVDFVYVKRSTGRFTCWVFFFLTLSRICTSDPHSLRHLPPSSSNKKGLAADSSFVLVSPTSNFFSPAQFLRHHPWMMILISLYFILFFNWRSLDKLV